MYSGLLKTYTGDVDKGKLEKLLHYNVYGGNMTRYNLFLITLRGINPAVDSSQIDNGKVLELLHMSFFILDDIIDNSNLRRGNPCWYIKRGMLSVKDAKFIMALTCSAVDINILKEFTRVVYITIVGEMLDSKPRAMEEYTLENYFYICETKTGVYTFYLPIILAYSCAGMEKPPFLEDFSRICGIGFQMKDDLLNFFPKLSKKTSNDLEEKRLTIFTAILSKDVENKDVVKYFETGEITSEFMDNVSQLYDIVNRLINENIEKLDGIPGIESFPALKFCKEYFNKS